MQMDKNVQIVKPKETYLHIAPKGLLGPPFHEWVVFFTESIF